MVYFIGNKEKQLVKIGKAKDPKKRKAAIQVGFPYDLETFLIIEGNEAIEHTLHHKFKHKNLRGEWFILDDEILAFIANPVIEQHNAFHNYENNIIQYTEDIEQKIEELYIAKLSNIDIAKQLDITIHKVRRIIKLRKLASKYRQYKYILSKECNFKRNIRKKYRKLYKDGLIPKSELDNILLQYPLDNRGKRPSK